ncbi:MAG: ROK family protein [Candidatus Eremiobacteraeota bacterium]|nr:ROK family protein [Candidatus Eremiobacteraeota bacterium]
MTAEGKPIVIGVDLGGSHVSAAAVDQKGTLLQFSERDIDNNKSADEILSGDIVPVIQETLEKISGVHAIVKGIGMGIPGRTDGERGVCIFAPNLKWREVQVREPLESLLHVPVFIINDVRAMTVGEKCFGNGRGFNDFICMALGTGIGGGVVANGKLVLGAIEGAGEIGHITVEPEGPLCGCGNKGCMEAFSSGPGVARRAMEALKRGASSILRDAPEITSKKVFEAAREGDALALEIWRETGIYLGRGLASIITVLNPRRILMAGRVSRAIEFFLPALKEELTSRARMVPPDFTEIVTARFGKDAGMIGTAAFAFEKLELV